MKQIFKDLAPAIVLSLTISFMLLIFEPITMYATNPNDFWFDLYDIFPILLSSCLIFTLCIFTPLLLCYIIFQVRLKKPAIYYIITVALFGLFLVTYIQGNFLAGTLPTISGTPFNWREYKTESLISVSLWAITFIVLLVALLKLKPAKVFSIVPIVTGAIFVMLSVSLVTTLTTPDALKSKFTPIATYKNFHLASNNQNFFIFLLDAVDSQKFMKACNDNQECQEALKDFSYYPDTTSRYPLTRDSIPYIFNPIPYYNETPFIDFSEKLFAESKFFQHLNNQNYTMNFFDDSFFMNRETSKNFQNIEASSKVRPNSLLKQLAKYDLFKYLPYPLKGKVHIENLNFANTKQENDHEIFDWDDTSNYTKFKSQPIQTINDKVFHFVHLEGAHVPYDLDKDLNPIKGGSYAQKTEASINVMIAYLNRLKESNVYHNSTIIIMADHGNTDVKGTPLERWFNPILFIKGINETHNELITSDKPIEQGDLQDAFIQLSDGSQSTDLFQSIDYPRTRTLIFVVWDKTDHMEEYQTDGKAWEYEKIVPTGNVYDLKQ